MQPVPGAHSRISSALLIALFAVSGNAQQSRITRPIDNAQRVTLSGHIHSKATPANDRGRVAPTLQLSYVTLTLTQSAAQQADLADLLAEQQNPSSPNYHRWLTPGQYADRFGVSREDISRITQWLQRQGLTIVEVSQGRNRITVSGSAAQIESALATEIHQYVVDGKTHFANATNPSVPAAIGGMLLSIRGLNDFRMKPRIEGPKYTKSSSGNHYLAPNDIATIYDILPAYTAGIDGSGQTIVIAGQTGVNLSDIQLYQSAYNLPANLPRTRLVGKDPGITGDLGEADLDLELAVAVARNATVLYVYSKDVMDAVHYAIDQNLAPVISVSYGMCEPETAASDVIAFQSWARQGNAQGITWFNSSGDDGAADCADPQNPGLAVDVPASIPEVTGVGGTEFQANTETFWNATNDALGGSALSYIPETSWNDPATPDYPISASGGGASIYFSKPSWQAGPGVPDDNARHVPDVALNSSANHNTGGYLVYTGGAVVVFGGTSCATPVMAGIAVLLNQYLVRTGTHSTAGLGNMNPNLYSLAQSQPAVFHDITTGNNIPQAGASLVGYYAGVGYDSVTGLGSVDARNLLTCWTGTCFSLIGNLNSVGFNDTASLTATVVSGNGVTPVGAVRFSAGGTALGGATLVGSAGTATATISVTGTQLPSGTFTITASWNGSSTSATLGSLITMNVRDVGSGSNGTPVIPANGLADAASFQQKFSPGMILSVFGASLSPADAADAAGSVPLPLTMAGISATVNGVAAPLYYVSPTQLNIQVPWQTTLGAATLTVNNNGQIGSQTFNIDPSSPGIFTDRTRTIVPNGSAAPGQITTLYIAGAGAVTPAVATGSAPATSTPLDSLPAPPNTTVTVGGVQASTPFVGIPYGLVGVTQINFAIPTRSACRAATCSGQCERCPERAGIRERNELKCVWPLFRIGGWEWLFRAARIPCSSSMRYGNVVSPSLCCTSIMACGAPNRTATKRLYANWPSPADCPSRCFRRRS